MEAIVEQKRASTSRDMYVQVACGSCTGGVFKPQTHHRLGRAHNYQGRVRMDQGYNRSHSEAETDQESRRYAFAALTGGACQLGHVTIYQRSCLLSSAHHR